MNNLKTLRPDLWIVCSPAVEQEIRVLWAEELDAFSLAALRLRQPGQLRAVAQHDAARTARELIREGCGSVHVIVESMGDQELDLDEALEALADELEHDIELLVWRESPMDVMASLASPEAAIVQAWMAGRELPKGFEVAGPWSAQWRDDYLRAVDRWAAAAEQHDPDDLTDWVELTGGDAARFDPHAANDWSWTEVQLGGLAADTPADDLAAMRRVPPPESAERWSLTRYPIVGQSAVDLMFEADASSVDRYVGCRIEVVAAGQFYDLGEVNEEGVAELRLEASVDISRAVVRIGTIHHKG